MTSTSNGPGRYRLNALVIVVALAAWPSAVVHVVDQVRRDEGKRRKLVVRQIGGQVRIGHVVTGAAMHRRVVDGRIVPHGVVAGVAVITARRHRFLV